MTSVLTLRLDDALHAELAAIARARDTTLSELARRALRALTIQDDGEAERAGTTEVPVDLSSYQRHHIALLHRILARLVDGTREDGDFNSQIALAETLEHGYVAEYDGVFAAIEPELSRRESDLVHDILEMFFHVEWSFTQLDDAQRATLDPGVERRVQFGGFDGNDRLEGRLLEYARHLVDEGKWERLAPFFTLEEHDRGNAHHRTLPSYRRMLEVFQPLWRQKVRKAIDSGSNDFRLDSDELTSITNALVQPDSRGAGRRTW